MHYPLLLTCLFILSSSTFAINDSVPSIPPTFAAAIPVDCQQIILVQADEITATSGKLWVLERADKHAPWKPALGPEPVSLGRKGQAWGVGLHHSPAPANIPIKQEGDNRTPLGVFRLPFLFGDQPVEKAGHHDKMPYQQMTEYHAGVDDSRSRYYNRIVDSRQVPNPDWKSAESMIPKGGSYQRGIFVAHNPHNQPGGGSCIFLHLWAKPMEPTSGCTAMSGKNMLKLFKRLDQSKQPVLVQTVDGL